MIVAVEVDVTALRLQNIPCTQKRNLQSYSQEHTNIPQAFIRHQPEAEGSKGLFSILLLALATLTCHFTKLLVRWYLSNFSRKIVSCVLI